MKDKYILIGIIVVIIIGVATFGFLINSGENTEEFYSNVESAYSHYTVVEDSINESKGYVDATSDEGIGKYIELNEKKLLQLDLEKDYLNKSLESTNDDVKIEYIDLLLKLNELEYDMSEENINIAAMEKQYYDGDITYSEYKEAYDEYSTKNNNLETEWFSIVDDVYDFLNENPEFKNELDSEINVDSTYRGLDPYYVEYADFESLYEY